MVSCRRCSIASPPSAATWVGCSARRARPMSIRRQTDEWLRAAEAARQAGRHDEAADLYRRVLGRRSADPARPARPPRGRAGGGTLRRRPSRPSSASSRRWRRPSARPRRSVWPASTTSGPARSCDGGRPAAAIPHLKSALRTVAGFHPGRGGARRGAGARGRRPGGRAHLGAGAGGPAEPAHPGPSGAGIPGRGTPDAHDRALPPGPRTRARRPRPGRRARPGLPRAGDARRGGRSSWRRSRRARPTCPSSMRTSPPSSSTAESGGRRARSTGGRSSSGAPGTGRTAAISADAIGGGMAGSSVRPAARWNSLRPVAVLSRCGRGRSPPWIWSFPPSVPRATRRSGSVAAIRCAERAGPGSLAWARPCASGVASRSASPRRAAPSTGRASCLGCRVDPPEFDRARGAGLYAGPLRHALHALKFRGKRALARPLAELIREQCAAGAARPAARPWCRCRWPGARLRERGFNQAELIADRLGAVLDLPVRRRWLARVRETAPQTDLAAADRRTNVDGAFVASSSVAGRHVVLVDDVLTTGATCRECARALRAAGARRDRRRDRRARSPA